jgi:2,4-dienoyl-CoA reductase (NADPH2)
MEALAALWQPLQVGGLLLKHRLVMGPMADSMWEDGLPLAQAIEYFRIRARGGAAMLVVGATEVDERSRTDHRGSLADDRFVPDMRRLTEAVHAEGVPILVQLHHGGASAHPPVSPSGVASLSTLKAGMLASHELSLMETERIRDRFIAAAVRAQAAGFDGVQLAGQANYLLGQFFSPRQNRRNDRYGGSDQARMTLALEIIDGIRQRCGGHFAIGYAISADELQPGGVVPRVCLPFAQAMEGAGLDYLDVRAGTHETFATSDRATGHSRFQSRHGIWPMAAEFKQVIKIPVFCSAQGCYEPAEWQAALSQGMVDVVQLGKAMLAEPELPDKLAKGRAADIRPCIYCMHCLDPFIDHSLGAKTYCAINAEAGAEAQFQFQRVSTQRRIVVAGAGPAGLEFARIAASRGHQVTVLERDAEPGGALRWIGRCDGGDVYLRWRDWLVSQCRHSGVDLHLSVEAGAHGPEIRAAEVVIVATGPARSEPGIKGADLQHVFDLRSALDGSAGLGDNVVVIGGGQAGVQVASTLAGQSPARRVTIVEAEPVSQLGAGMAYMERVQASVTQLPERGVEAIIGLRVAEITRRHVVLVDDEAGNRQRLPADNVVLALAPRAGHPRLADDLARLGIAHHVIGDASRIGTLGNAIHEAARLGRSL